MLLRFASLVLEIMNSSCPHVADLPLHITEPPKKPCVALHVAIMVHVVLA